MSAAGTPGGPASPRLRVDAIVVVAMPDEAAAVLDLAEDAGRPETAWHAERRLLRLAGRQVLLLRSGIGLVAAASALATTLREVDAGAVIGAGSAGGLGARVRVGDVVVGTQYVYPGADARAFGYALGQVPGMPAAFDADPGLVAAALAWAEGAGTGVRDDDPGTGPGRGSGPDDGSGARPSGGPGAAPDGGPGSGPVLRVLPGTVLSGDRFVDAGMVDELRAAFPAALATDMESTALAQVCHVAGVRFVAVRGISDLCGPAAGDDFLTHVDDAAQRSARVVAGLLARGVG